MFQKAQRIQKKLRLAISGVSGSGKTYSALALASSLGSKIAVIDTEHGSSNLYEDDFDYDVCDLTQHHPDKYIEAIRAGVKAGYDVIIIDSLSHAWFQMLDMAGGNFNNWARVAQHERNLIEAMLGANAHIIATMRSKSDYMDGTGANGKVQKIKVGTKSVMRDGIEYEFDIAGTMDLSNVLTIDKSRCKALQSTIWHCPGAELAGHLKRWLSEGTAAVDSAINEFKDRQSRQTEGFKAAREAAGLGKDDAIALLKRFGVDHPKELSAEDYQACIELMEEAAAAADCVKVGLEPLD